MKLFETKTQQLGDVIFHVRPLPALTAANISGELFGTLLPALGSLAPMMGEKTDPASLLDIDSAEAAKALAKGMSSISGDKLEYLLKKLLIQHRNISFEQVGPFDAKKPDPQVLTEDIANELFCGDVQDMFILAFDVIKSNYSGFFEKLGSLFGDHIGAFKSLITKATQPGSKNTAT